jgi:hypothetical protein
MKRSLGYQLDGVSVAAIFPSSHVAAGVASTTNYEIRLGTGYLHSIEVGAVDAAGATELWVEVYDQRPYRSGEYQYASIRSSDGLYLPGANTGIVTYAGVNAAVNDEHVVDTTAATNESRWNATIATATSSAANLAPIRVAAFVLPVAATVNSQRFECHAECLRGMAIVVRGRNAAGAVQAVDHIFITPTWQQNAGGDSRVPPKALNSTAQTYH